MEIQITSSLCEMINDMCQHCCPDCGGCQCNVVCQDANWEQLCPEGAECEECGEEVFSCAFHECAEEDEHQPDEAQEWHDFDPDC